LFVHLILLRESFTITRFFSVLIILLFWIGLYSLSRLKQKHTLASVILVGLFFGLACFLTFEWGIFIPAGVLMFSLVIIMAGILLGARYSLYAALATSTVLIGLEVAKAHHWIMPNVAWMQRPSIIGDAIAHSILYALIALISWLFNRQMEMSLKRARRSEKALKHQKDNLEIKVKERTRELELAQLEKMQQFYRFAELGHLSTALFHDLANHLMSISVDIEGLQAEQRSDILERIQKNMRHIDDVVRSVRQHIQGKNSIESFNVTDEVREVSKILAMVAEEARTKIVVNDLLSKKPVLFKGDVTRFRQLVTNLVSNGIEAYDGTTFLQRTVDVGLATDKHNLILTVTDHGVGISPAMQEKIFEPFYSTKEKGIGIGLFIIKKVTVEDFGGSLAVVSNKEDGTVFTATLPLAHHVKRSKA